MLISELADPENRGVLTTVHQLFLVIGIFFVSLLAYALVSTISHGWQYVLAFQIVPAALQIFLNKYIPESPKWLIRHGREGDALQVLLSLRPPSHDSQEEIDEFKRELQQDIDNKSTATWGDLFGSGRPAAIGSLLMFFQAMTGINTVIFYSTTIFGFAGFSQAILATASVDGVNFAATVVAAYLIDRVGRKFLLLLGQYIMIASLLLLAVILYVDVDAELQGIIAVVAALIYIAGFAVGLGAAIWSVINEIMPSRLRAKGMSLFLSINWFFNLLIAFGTISTINFLGDVNDDADDDTVVNDAKKRGVSLLYFIFFGITLLSLTFTHVVVPETAKSGADNESQVPLLEDDDAKNVYGVNLLSEEVAAEEAKGGADWKSHQ